MIEQIKKVNGEEEVAKEATDEAPGVQEELLTEEVIEEVTLEQGKRKCCKRKCIGWCSIVGNTTIT